MDGFIHPRDSSPNPPGSFGERLHQQVIAEEEAAEEGDALEAMLGVFDAPEDVSNPLVNAPEAIRACIMVFGQG